MHQILASFPIPTHLPQCHDECILVRKATSNPLVIFVKDQIKLGCFLQLFIKSYWVCTLTKISCVQYIYYINLKKTLIFQSRILHGSSTRRNLKWTSGNTVSDLGKKPVGYGKWDVDSNTTACTLQHNYLKMPKKVT